MTSFNDGIEEAAEEVRCGIAIVLSAMNRNGPERWAYAVDALKDALDAIEALKRPEPSEMDKVSSGAKVVLDWFQGDECTHVLSAVTLSELRALAALKAMEGE